MLKSYVIRQNNYTAAQKKSYDALSGSYIIPLSDEKLDFKKVYGNTNGITLEIGFGMGFATALIAEENPCKNYLGVEVHRPGIGKLLWEIEKRSLSNIRIIEHDAVIVVEKMIDKNSLDAVHIFFPDPWQKRRHHKRRLIQRPFTEILANCISPGGYFYMVTDWEDYANHAMNELKQCVLLENEFEDFAPSQSWRPVTKFEKKGLEKNHRIRELFFKRII